MHLKLINACGLVVICVNICNGLYISSTSNSGNDSKLLAITQSNNWINMPKNQKLIFNENEEKNEGRKGVNPKNIILPKFATATVAVAHTEKMPLISITARTSGKWIPHSNQMQEWNTNYNETEIPYHYKNVHNSENLKYMPLTANIGMYGNSYESSQRHDLINNNVRKNTQSLSADSHINLSETNTNYSHPQNNSHSNRYKYRTFNSSMHAKDSGTIISRLASLHEDTVSKEKVRFVDTENRNTPLKHNKLISVPLINEFQTDKQNTRKEVGIALKEHQRPDYGKWLQNNFNSVNHINGISEQYHRQMQSNNDRHKEHAFSDIHYFTKYPDEIFSAKEKISQNRSDNQHINYKTINHNSKQSVPIRSHIINNIVEKVHQPYENLFNNNQEQIAKSLTYDNSQAIDEGGLQRTWGTPTGRDEISQIYLGVLPEGDEKYNNEEVTYYGARQKQLETTGATLELDDRKLRSNSFKEPSSSYNNSNFGKVPNPNRNQEKVESEKERFINQSEINEFKKHPYIQQANQYVGGIDNQVANSSSLNEIQKFLLSKDPIGNKSVLNPGRQGSVQFLSPAGPGLPALRIISLRNGGNYELPKGIKMQSGEVIPGTMGLIVPVGFRAHVIFGNKVADSIRNAPRIANKSRYANRK